MWLCPRAARLLLLGGHGRDRPEPATHSSLSQVGLGGQGPGSFPIGGVEQHNGQTEETGVFLFYVLGRIAACIKHSGVMGYW